MIPPDSGVLTLTPDATGWCLGGTPWHPDGPFYAVLGDPIGHSLSPRFQGAALRSAELPYGYHAVRITSSELAPLLANRHRLALAGFNVTAPHKHDVAGLCLELTDAAKSTGAVNTVRVSEDGWVGHNTDVGGIREVLDDALREVRPDVALVLGAGGVARAAVTALIEAGIDRVIVMARSGESRDRLDAWLQDAPDHRTITSLALWETIPAAIAEAAAFACVSCIPKGIVPPTGLAGRSACAFWLDMAYGEGVSVPPGLSPRVYRDGVPVLLAQGALSFTWWFDRVAPRRVMAEALIGR